MASFWSVAAGAVCLKLLLLPSYRSTDFDVHRNWLAITHSLPVRKWYFEATSEWTLDYPPLFAWFEYMLSQFAVFFDSDMLKVENVDYASPATVVFQRLSVIVADFVYLFAVKEFCQKCLPTKKTLDVEDIFNSPPLVLAALLISNFGLLIVDHIHFQYNGLLFGLLLLSVVRIYEGRNLSAAFWFSVLLNFKHIYLYVAPAYFVYLLRCYVFQSNPEDGSLRWRSFSILRLIILGLIVISVFTVSFGPFILLNQVPQVLSRLFPFKRGLCHAYWAPNFWVFYNVADKVLSTVGSRLGLTPSTNVSAVMTGGLVQEFHHTTLPSVSPLATVIITALTMVPSLAILWSRPKGPQSFLRALILCAYSSFMFGWHVHEKAVLLIIIPLSLLVMDKKRDAQLYLLMSTIGHYSLFPLLFTPAESPVKVVLLLLTATYAFISLGNIYRFPWSSLTSLPLLSMPESIYLLGIIPLECYNSIIHSAIGLSAKLPFLPLLLASLYCAIGVTYCWIKFYWLTYHDKPKYGKQS